jgi:hypothetical protein
MNKDNYFIHLLKILAAVIISDLVVFGVMWLTQTIPHETITGIISLLCILPLMLLLGYLFNAGITKRALFAYITAFATLVAFGIYYGLAEFTTVFPFFMTFVSAQFFNTFGTTITVIGAVISPAIWLLMFISAPKSNHKKSNE